MGEVPLHGLQIDRGQIGDWDVTDGRDVSRGTSPIRNRPSP
jgi:hypothetical protein